MLVVRSYRPLQSLDQNVRATPKKPPCNEHVTKFDIGQGRLYTGLVNAKGQPQDIVGRIDYLAQSNIYKGEKRITSTYIGQVENGLPHGVGKLLQGNITIKEGRWIKGVFEEKKVETKTDSALPKMRSGFLNATDKEIDLRMTEDNLSDDVYFGDTKDGLVDGIREGMGTLFYSGNTYVGQFKDDLPHGQGKIVYANKDEYIGEFKKGRLDGHGTYKVYVSPGKWNIMVGTFNDCEFEGEFATPNGDRYLGQALYDRIWLFHGNGSQFDSNGNKFIGIYQHNKPINGRCEFSNGDVYEGDWKDHKFHGKGEWQSNSWTYKGDFVADKRHGIGTLKTANLTYVGDFVDDIRKGKGKLVHNNGQVYDGSFENNEYEGEGILKFPDGSSYTGSFHEGEFDGIGTFENSDGNIFEGVWVKGKLEGKGTCKHKNGRFYEGHFVNTAAEGHGVLTYPNGNRYEGNFVDGEMEGIGTMHYKDNGTYQGMWKKGIREGKGIRVYQNGTRYEGEYLNDAMHGIGEMYNSDFYVKGQWIDGVNSGKGLYINKEINFVYGELKNCRPEGNGGFLVVKDDTAYKCTVYNCEAVDGVFKNITEARIVRNFIELADVLRKKGLEKPEKKG